MSRLDYAAIRERISICQVLELFDYKPFQRRGDQWRGPCPICCVPSGASARCFSVNVRRSLFQCFRCQRSGNSLDLWAELTGLAIYEATFDLCHKFNIRPVPISNPQPRNTS